MSIEPFRIAVSQERLDWIGRRLRDAQWPTPSAGDPWAIGTSDAAMRELVDYWLTRYDWRVREARMNALPQFIAEVPGDGRDWRVHFIHVPGKGPAPKPVMMIHGWPGSFVEFMDVIGPLTDPAAHGGKAEDAVTLVIPSLLGYGFSSKPSAPVGPRTIARAFAAVMRELGHHNYIAQGGDWGSSVSGWLGYEAPACKAVHLNFTFGWSAADALPETDEENAAMARLADVWRTEGAYMAVQSTKPRSLAYAMMDSPLGVAAWIVEKFHGWSPLLPTNMWDAFSRDQVLDNIMIYLVTGTFDTASWLYRGVFDEPVPAGARVEKPTAIANFPGELAAYPRSLVEKSFNVVRWTEMPRGGHFAAMEAPADFVADIQAFARDVRF